jgi:hypothetical protein
MHLSRSLSLGAPAGSSTDDGREMGYARSSHKPTFRAHSSLRACCAPQRPHTPPTGPCAPTRLKQPKQGSSCILVVLVAVVVAVVTI